MKPSEPQISIIIPVYNVSDCLRVGLNSILHQSFTNYEVILVNDGSTDDSQAICEEYVKADSRFKLFNQKNVGVADARNRGLDNACGEYVVFMDSDDWVESEWLQAYMSFARDSSPDLMVQGVIYDRAGHLLYKLADEAFYEGKAVFEGFREVERRGLEGYTHNKIYKLCLIKRYGLKFRYQLHEDTLFNIEYVTHTASLKVIAQAHYHYIQHNGGSLITRRYPFVYMMSLNTSIRDARLRMMSIFDRKDCEKEAWEKYFVLFTVLLLSLYDKKNGIAQRLARLKIWHTYQHERRAFKDISLHFPTKSKYIFSYIAMFPPFLIDFVLNLIFTLKNRF